MEIIIKHTIEIDVRKLYNELASDVDARSWDGLSFQEQRDIIALCKNTLRSYPIQDTAEDEVNSLLGELVRDYMYFAPTDDES